MENATKALIIAASVLVAILIISLGVGIYTSASEQIGSVDLSEYQKQQFNRKFTYYDGKTITGTEANALIQTVFSHNNAQDGEGTCVEVTASRTSKTLIEKKNNIIKMPNPLSAGNTYTVTCYYEDGLINKIDLYNNW